MLRPVSKLTLAALVWALFAWLCIASGPAHATTANGTVGVDAWATPDTQVRYLPNYSTPNAWRSVGAWARGTIQHEQATDIGLLTLTAQARASQVEGTRVDRLDADLRVSDGAGVRVGVLPYRLSWCRTYDTRSPWLSEPDAFCRFSGLNEVAQGAFGGQAYTSTIAGGWVIDAMAGVYRPRVDGQNDKLGPFKSVGPTVAHKAYGASANALHLATGIQTRIGWLKTQQAQDSATGGFQRRLDYDSLYVAAEGNVSKTLDLRASVAQYVGDQQNPANLFKWVGRSYTAEAIFKPVPGHSFALGISEYVNRTTYAKPPNGQIVRVPTASVAWRFDLPDQWYGVAQISRSEDTATTRQGVTTAATGTAYGLRIAKSF